MKVEELMIGDWVSCTYPTIKKPLRVEEIRTVGDNELKIILSDDELRLVFSERYIEPIPLTPEILKKNFTITEVRVLSVTKTLYTESDDFYCIALNEYTDSIWELEYTNCEAHFPLVRVLVAHVHELQNALRLIGIDKEIVI